MDNDTLEKANELKKRIDDLNIVIEGEKCEFKIHRMPYKHHHLTVNYKLHSNIYDKIHNVLLEERNRLQTELNKL